MSKLPSFQFYPGDWAKDANLRRCTKAEKGLWIDMLCVVFECEERGFFISAGKPWTKPEIAEAAGGDKAENLLLLSSLLGKGVARIDKRGAIYSARMARDESRRRQLKENGKKGGNPSLVNQTSNQGVNQTPNQKGGSSSSSSTSDPPYTPPPDFKKAFPVLCRLFGIERATQRDEITMYDAWIELRAKKATNADVKKRIARYREMWPDLPVTPNAILKHWHTCKPVEKTLTPPIDDGHLPDSLLPEDEND